MTAINLLPYQKKWLDDGARFKIAMYSRQTGKSTMASVEAVSSCIHSKNKEDWFIISSGERQAKKLLQKYTIPLCRAYEEAFKYASKKDSRLKELNFLENEYSKTEITFANGSTILALPANPESLRGYSGNVILDEFAFHNDSYSVWEAVFPIISSGYKIRVLSTPNGKGNKFYELMTTENNGWSKHIVSIYDAVKQGLPRNIEELKMGLSSQDSWEQEYELKWRDSASSWLSFELIDNACHKDAGLPELYQGGYCYIGIDIAARNDPFAVVVLEKVGDVFWLRELIAVRNISFREQDFILERLMREYKVVRCCIDQTGMGEKPVEDAKIKYGRSRVEGVLFNTNTKQAMATIGREVFEDCRIRIPFDRELRQDLHKLKQVTSATGAPRFVAESDSNGHADRTWALFLALTAGITPIKRYEYTPMEKPKRFGAY